MVTFNIETDLDIVNEAKGETIKIVLDENESNYSPTQSFIQLKYPPMYMPISMKSSKVSSLEGLEQNIIPLMPMEHTFLITQGSQSRTVVHKQLPFTAAYTFTDGTSTPFNIYVASS